MHEPTASYSDADRARWVLEPPKEVERTAFARDRARVVHSASLRRLGGKTQVLGAGFNDFSRTRLTHSLEVAQVGREIAMTLGCDPDIVDAACLSHDLGHPPFGHHGESVLNGLTKACGGFEGNAQTLRILTRLEPKVMTVRDGKPVSVGLNLSRAVLDASIKYPWCAGAKPGTVKFGHYPDDAPVFEWIRGSAPAHVKCFEAQVMDIADDVAYSTHDFEDAIAGGFLDPHELRVERHRAAVCEIARRFAPGCSDEQMHAALRRLEAHPLWLTTFHGSRSELAKLKDLTSQLIGRFAVAAREATAAEHADVLAAGGMLARYQGTLRVPSDTVGEISVLKALAVHFVMNNQSRLAVYERQTAVLTGLFDVLINTGSKHLEPMFAHDFSEADTKDAQMRVVADQIASLTDTRAVRWHSRLYGP